MEYTDILIVGAGAAGLSAAKGAYKAGCRSITLVDRKPQPGGVLLQCAHRGFGSELTGPAYAAQLLENLPENVVFRGDTTVLSLSRDRIASLSGGQRIRFGQLILAAGCREIPLGALPIAGTRPAGIFTAGDMQERMNCHSFVPEGPAVILGSGDLGLIMARQLAVHGIAVTLVEQRETCGGMARNQRCLQEHPIRLICGATVAEIRGERRLEGCILSDGSFLPCRTLLIAAGLRPEQDLIRDLGDPDWLFLCGNCRRVYPMVEAVITEAEHTGFTAWQYMRGSP